MKSFLLGIFLVGCLGGQSGTPTPFVPDPGCVATGQTPIDDWEQAQTLFAATTGTWSGECDGQTIELTLPALDAERASGDRIHNEWNAFGDDEVAPQECRDGYDVRFGADLALADAVAPFEMHATHARYVSTSEGMPADIDRYARPWFELFAQATFNEDDASALTMPLPDGPAVVSAAVYALLSEDGTTLSGTFEWFGYAADAEPPITPPGEPGEGTDPSNPDPSNPNPGPVATEPATLIATCSFALHQN